MGSSNAVWWSGKFFWGQLEIIGAHQESPGVEFVADVSMYYNCNDFATVPAQLEEAGWVTSRALLLPKNFDMVLLNPTRLKV